MDNTYCHEKYDVSRHKENSNKITFDDKLVIGGYILSLLVLSTFVLYGTRFNADLLTLR